MTKLTTPLDLIPLIGYQEFTQAISWYKAVNPKPWEHDESESFTPSSCDVTRCLKCGKQIITVVDAHSDCSIPDTFTGSLGDLHFALVDKAIKECPDETLAKAFFEVYKRCSDVVESVTGCVIWFLYNPNPAYGIIAALYAIELAGKENK